MLANLLKTDGGTVLSLILHAIVAIVTPICLRKVAKQDFSTNLMHIRKSLVCRLIMTLYSDYHLRLLLYNRLVCGIHTWLLLNYHNRVFSLALNHLYGIEGLVRCCPAIAVITIHDIHGLHFAGNATRFEVWLI